MKIQKLTIQGFRSFKEHTEIIFPESGLTSIQGKDIRTGASSGSGKSSILEALFFALGLNDLPATELKNFDSEEIEVTLAGTCAEGSFYILRSGSKLELILNGSQEKGSKPDLKKKITGMMGGDEDLFRFLTYRRQLDRGLFFHKDDAILKGILSKCFPELEKAEIVAEVAKKALNTAEITLDVLKTRRLSDTRVQGIELNLIEISSRLELVEQAIFTTQAPSVTSPELKVLQDRLKEASVDDSEGLKSEIKLLDKTINENLTRIKSIQSQFNSAELSYQRQVDSLKQEIVQLGATKQALEKQRTSFLAATCPTCSNADAKLVVKGHLCSEEIEKITVEASNKVKQARTLIRPVKEELNEAITALDNTNKNLRFKKDELNQQLTTKISSAEFILREIETVKAADYSKAESKRKEHSALLDTKRALNHNAAELKRQLSDNLKVAADIQKVETTIQIETALCAILGKKGLLGLFFSELLDDATTTANKILEQLPNTLDLTIELGQSLDTQTGVTKNKLNAKFSKAGRSISFRSLSGGQQTSASFAVDLALTLAVKRRCHIPFDFLTLDEPMDGMGKAEKEAAVEVLRTLLDGRLVILIDHATEINELFDQVIKVEYDGYNSRCVNDV